jgi:hypothetical protein
MNHPRQRTLFALLFAAARPARACGRAELCLVLLNASAFAYVC